MFSAADLAEFNGWGGVGVPDNQVPFRGAIVVNDQPIPPQTRPPQLNKTENNNFFLSVPEYVKKLKDAGIIDVDAIYTLPDVALP
jgi:hypothetical protein